MTLVSIFFFKQGRLDEFLEDPSSGEMLHHLFPPLAYLVDECFDLFDEDLVRDVVFPLPTPKAVHLLETSLGEREAVIWRALGQNWLNPKYNAMYCIDVTKSLKAYA